MLLNNKNEKYNKKVENDKILTPCVGRKNGVDAKLR